MADSDVLREANIEITPEDMVAAMRLMTWTTYRKDYMRFVVIWLVCVAVYGAILLYLGGIRNFGSVLLIVAVVAALAFFLFPLLIVYLVGPSSARKTYRVQKSLHGPVRVNWDDKTAHFHHPTGDARLNWADAYRLASNDKILLIYESERLYRMIPKRFLSAAQIADLDSIAENAARAASGK